MKRSVAPSTEARAGVALADAIDVTVAAGVGSAARTGVTGLVGGGVLSTSSRSTRSLFSRFHMLATLRHSPVPVRA